MDFYRQMAEQRDLVAPIAEEMGLPNIRSLIICQRSSSAADKYIEIIPKPVIESISPRLMATYEGISSVRFELDDQSVSGISRFLYTKEQLVGSGISYLIDGKLEAGVVTGGFEADLVPGMQLVEKGTAWSLMVRRRKGKR